MIQLTQAGKRYGPKLLFDGLDWLINTTDRIGIVGGNGTGKSTLLKTIAGLESLDYGSLIMAKGVTRGYLPQDGLSLSGRSIFEECMSVFDEIRAYEKEMEVLTHKMSELHHESPEYAAVADRYHHIEHLHRAHDGYSLDSQVGAVLAGLGFSREDWSRRTEEFSGGWQMRIALGKLLLQRPNFLLLDEPTNHLDLESRNWLEEFLGNYPFSYILISHDRYFLDVTVNKTVEIWNKKVHFYTGNYEKYLREKAERLIQVTSAYKNQRDKIEQLELFINRFRAQATKAKQVQSRIKELEKIERIEVPEEESTIHFKFPQPKPSGRIIMEAKGLAKSYGTKDVFKNVDFVIERGERIALVGVNGAGKSTLIKLLSGLELPTAGELKVGHNVEADYFAQDQYKELDGSRRMLDDLELVAPHSTQTELRTLLGCFIFSGDDVFKTLGVLSGGERNRYALARMLLQPSNFLLLDEPTNHLDMRAKDVLLTALERFTGTVVFVSHDRYFIDKLATRVFEVGDGGVHVFPGNYEDYLYRKQRMASGQHIGDLPVRPAEQNISATSQTVSAAVKGAPGPLPKPKRINPIKLKQMQDRLAHLETAIQRLEASIAITENSLLSFVSAEETHRLNILLEQNKKDLTASVSEWEQLGETMNQSNPQ